MKKHIFPQFFCFSDFMHKLAESLQGNPGTAITVLNLSQNQIEDKGVCPPPPSPPTHIVLDLGGSGVSVRAWCGV